MFSTILLPPRAQLCIRYCSNKQQQQQQHIWVRFPNKRNQGNIREKQRCFWYPWVSSRKYPKIGYQTIPTNSYFTLLIPISYFCVLFDTFVSYLILLFPISYLWIFFDTFWSSFHTFELFFDTFWRCFHTEQFFSHLFNNEAMRKHTTRSLLLSPRACPNVKRPVRAGNNFSTQVELLPYSSVTWPGAWTLSRATAHVSKTDRRSA
jgi:hypothetical protein